MGLRFRTHQTLMSFVYSTSDTVREIRHVAASPPATLAPGPDRLRYYDLPRIWKSKKYYTRNLPGSPPASEKFFQNLTAPDILNSELVVTSTTAPRELVFCLDDIILTKANLVQHSLAGGHRVTVFHHKFANRRPDMAPGATWPHLNNEGVHKPGAAVNQQGYPYTNFAPTVLYYITDYADWTRLVIAQGNLFDVFADRTPDVAANDVVGARAAVRWVDATTMPNGVPPLSTVAGTPGTIAPRPAATQKAFFTIQPFYEQQFLITYGGGNPQAGAIQHNEWAAAYPGPGAMGIGRVDMVLLRCTDWDGGNEVSVALRYLKFNIDLATASNDNSGNPQANPLAGSPPAARMNWVQSLVDNCTARWNGRDAQNTARVWVEPQPSSPPGPPLRTQIVTIFQYTQLPWAHSNIRSCAPSIPPVSMTSFMNAFNGDGQIRVNAAFHDGTNAGVDAWGAAHVNRGLPAAHELGHGMTLPDEYDNNAAHSPNYTALNLLGSPYNMENRGLMLLNWSIRARYLWVVAEWMRTLRGLRSVPFQLRHFDSGPPGGRRAINYSIPHYPHQAANPTRNFVSWPVAFNLRQTPNPANFDSALYILGDDKYSSVVLPNQIGGGARIDGILLVLFRMQVDFRGVGGNPAFKTNARNQFFTAATAAIEPMLNFTRFARFRIGAAASTPHFQRCLLHFRACFTDQGVSPAWMDNSAPHHLRIVLTRAAVAAPAINTWTPNPAPTASVLLIDVPNDFATNAAALAGYIAACANFTFQNACTTMGLSSANAPAANSFQTPASYVPIVRSVMDAAAPAPNVT
jgi:hypothetical protein